jgi:hypothetical protein
MLTWDTYTYGSFLATLIPQTITSLADMTVNLMFLVVGNLMFSVPGGGQYISFALTFVSTALCAVHWYLWVKGSRSFKCSVKDMRCPPKPESGISVFGWKRPLGERRRFGRVLPRWFSSVIFRRIENIESNTSAVMRNIFAMLLLAILVVQSAVLFRSVLYEVFPNRVTSPTLGEVILVPSDAIVNGILHERESGQYWSPHILFSTSSNISTHDILKAVASCQSFASWEPKAPMDLESCDPPVWSNQSLEPAGVFDIALTVDAHDPDPVLKPGGIWISTQYSYSLYSSYPVFLMPGYHLFGLVEFIEWRYIRSSFLEALGFNPVYHRKYPILINWVPQRIQLNHTSIARATIQFPPTQAQISRIVLEYRTHTFLSALTSIGGLLAVFQGIHLLCFGRPLFWGLFGSKLLDPFGIFGRLSNGLQEKIRKKYISEPSNTLDLRSFLNDFVIEMGPLDPEKQDGSGREDEIELLVSREIQSSSGSRL